MQRIERTLLLACAALLALPAAAAGGKIPIHQLPLTIDTPGSYVLTRDVTHSAAGNAITIEASDVTIDFAGHTLTKTSQGNYTISLSGDYTNITIMNGTIRGGNIGIRLYNNTGDDFATRVENMTILGTLNEGIQIQGQSLVGSSHTVVRNNAIHDVGGDGMYLRYMWGGRVEGNVVQDVGDTSADHGIQIHNARGLTIHGNTVSNAYGDGLRLWYSWYCTFDWNHLTYNNDWGVNVYSGDQIVFSNNRAYGNGNGGFTIPGAEGHVNAGGNYPPPQ